MPNQDRYEINYLKEFDFLGKDYRELFNNSQATAFQSPLWLHHLYDYLVPALGAEPTIVAVNDKQIGKLCLLMPMVRVRYAGLSCVEPADLGICDYNAIVANQELTSSFFSEDGLREQIQTGLQPYHLIFFRKMPGECELIGKVMGKPKVGDMNSCSHHVKIWGPYEDWQQEIMSSGFRKELRRKRRKLEQFGKVKFEVLTDPEEIRGAMNLLREQRGQRYEDDLLQQEPYFEFYSRVAIEGAKTGECQTAVLSAGDEVAAVEFGIIHDQCYHFLLAGFNEAQFAKSSPGILMIEHILQERIRLGDTRADFTIGDEPYKAKYGATPVQLKHMALSDSFLGDLALKAYNSTGPIRDLAKKVAKLG